MGKSRPTLAAKGIGARSAGRVPQAKDWSTPTDGQASGVTDFAVSLV